jgi:16S rRNA (guanine966-N2)-methyltransferase
MIRVIAGRWRGRRLAVPPGLATRPTSDRARQALFDMLWHAPWAGRDAVDGARVLDAFAGSGALGIEALSRGAAEAVFIEHDAAALRVLRANVAALDGARVIAADATLPPAPPFAATLAFLDPPYGQGLAARALAALAARGWFAEGAILCVETGRDEALDVPALAPLDDRAHGKARLRVFRVSAGNDASR